MQCCSEWLCLNRTGCLCVVCWLCSALAGAGWVQAGLDSKHLNTGAEREDVTLPPAQGLYNAFLTALTHAQ